jgi:hypothetical protein
VKVVTAVTVYAASMIVYMAFWLLLLHAHHAAAHGLERWIADKQLNDPVTGQFCCGPADCHILEDNEVQDARGGWLIKTPADREPEFVPFDRALPMSQDGRYHRCTRYQDGKLQSRCFIIPPPTY